ncbi:MAG: DUF401 family protein [Pseudomonadota bacterium]
MLETIPAVVRVFLIFGLILTLIRFKLSLGNAFVIGAAVLGMVFGMTPGAVIVAAGSALVDPKTLSLSLVVSLILVLSHSLEKTGQMGRLLERFAGLIKSPRLNIVIFPALIGLLPMPGGAIFSAPMVKNIGGRSGLSGPQLSFINYWFRHLWEYWWPLYPGVLLTTALAGIDLWTFVLTLFPLTVVATVAGYLNLRRMMPANGAAIAEQPRRALVIPFLKELAPVLIAIVPGIVLGNLLEGLLVGRGAAVAKELGLIIALAGAIGWVWWVNDLQPATIRRIVFQKELLAMVYMVSAILIFKGVMLDSRAVGAVNGELMRWQVPLVAIAVVLPFIVGLVVGITIAFVGAAFPIIISLVTATGASDHMLAYMMLGLAGGFAGVLLSPLHLCLLLSNTYFGTGLGPVYRYLWRPCLVLVIGSLVYFFILMRWG